MISLEEYANVLSDFGLTHNQAKAYIAAVQLGIASISQVSKVSKVR
jgi:sugar-specific transcriptional regulator TrmB